MNKKDSLAKMKYKLEDSYTQYKFTIIKNDLVMMHNKSVNTFIDSLAVPILRYKKPLTRWYCAFQRLLAQG